MLVFRIVLHKYANQLVASGRAARWNSNDMRMLYTSGSRSLACLENIVHRSRLGLSANFSVMHIEIPDSMKMTNIALHDLPKNWNDFDQLYFTQRMGDQWIKENQTTVLRVPSSIIQDEHNYLLNPGHLDFAKIRLLAVKPFFFDERIKD